MIERIQEYYSHLTGLRKAGKLSQLMLMELMYSYMLQLGASQVVSNSAYPVYCFILGKYLVKVYYSNLIIQEVKHG